MKLKLRRWLYSWRFVNWLIAKPWRWHYRSHYRWLRDGFDGQVTFSDGRTKHYPELAFEPYGRLGAAWKALTFPHVHGEWELEEDARLAATKSVPGTS